ncbi:MAG: trypsin-like serine protease [Pseudomonadota bacterium]
MASRIKYSGVFTHGLTAALSCIAISISACQNISSNSEEKIVGGSKDIPLNHPGFTSTVAIVYEDAPATDRTAACTGTVVAKNLILTAAHCIESENKDILNVYFTKNTENGAIVLKKIKVADFRKFPKYLGGNGDLSFDMAWLKLAEPIPDFAVPVPILIDDKLLASQIPVDLAGYGKITMTMSARPFEKRFVTVHIDKFYNKAPYHSLLLFREPEKGMCYGDSGGPLFIKANEKWAVAGVTKGLMGRPLGATGECKNAGIYTFPGMYIDWLEETSGTKLIHIGENKSEQISKIWPKDSVTSIEQLCEKQELSKSEHINLYSIQEFTGKVNCAEAIKLWKAKR